jgi:hypothetical protein
MFRIGFIILHRYVPLSRMPQGQIMMRKQTKVMVVEQTVVLISDQPHDVGIDKVVDIESIRAEDNPCFFEHAVPGG